MVLSVYGEGVGEPTAVWSAIDWFFPLTWAQSPSFLYYLSVICLSICHLSINHLNIYLIVHLSTLLGVERLSP
jgi:hypothetical protein